MLVLSRKVGERVQIGSDVEIVVLEQRGNRVKLGITAPLEISIIRREKGNHSYPERERKSLAAQE